MIHFNHASNQQPENSHYTTEALPKNRRCLHNEKNIYSSATWIGPHGYTSLQESCNFGYTSCRYYDIKNNKENNKDTDQTARAQIGLHPCCSHMA